MSELDGIGLPRTEYGRQIDTINKCLDETRNEEIKKLSEIDVDLHEIMSKVLMNCQEKNGDLDPSRVAAQIETELDLLVKKIKKAKLDYLEPIIKNLEEEKDIKDFLAKDNESSSSAEDNKSSSSGGITRRFLWENSVRERLTRPLSSAIRKKIETCWQEKINAFVLAEQTAMKSEATKEKIVPVNSVNESI